MADYATIGETFEKVVTLTAAEISAFAARIDDLNPLHHDTTFTAQTRFKGIIASGPHVLAILMAMTATHFSGKGHHVLGLNFTCEFAAPVYPEQELQMRWEVIDVLHKETLEGDVVTMEGSVQDEGGNTLLKSRGQVLVTDAL